jgi:hypothetical protein
MSKKYSFEAKVWAYPGLGAWWFVNVPDSISVPIRKKYGKGLIKINIVLGKSKYNSALFPSKNSKGEFGYLISVKKKVRESEGIVENDIIKISFNIL